MLSYRISRTCVYLMRFLMTFPGGIPPPSHVYRNEGFKQEAHRNRQIHRIPRYNLLTTWLEFSPKMWDITLLSWYTKTRPFFLNKIGKIYSPNNSLVSRPKSRKCIHLASLPPPPTSNPTLLGISGALTLGFVSRSPRIFSSCNLDKHIDCVWVQRSSGMKHRNPVEMEPCRV